MLEPLNIARRDKLPYPILASHMSFFAIAISLYVIEHS